MPLVKVDPHNEPTLTELQNALRSRFSGEFERDPFEAVAEANAAIYWFAQDYRCGHGNLAYIVAASDYHPSNTEAACPDDVRELYDELVRVFAPFTESVTFPPINPATGDVIPCPQNVDECGETMCPHYSPTYSNPCPFEH